MEDDEREMTTTVAECAICNEDYLRSTVDVVAVHCGHIFHHNCLLLWFKNSVGCPLCRLSLRGKPVIKLYFGLTNDPNPERINASLREKYKRNKTLLSDTLEEFNRLKKEKQELKLFCAKMKATLLHMVKRVGDLEAASVHSAFEAKNKNDLLKRHTSLKKEFLELKASAEDRKVVGALLNASGEDKEMLLRQATRENLIMHIHELERLCKLRFKKKQISPTSMILSSLRMSKRTNGNAEELRALSSDEEQPGTSVEPPMVSSAAPSSNEQQSSTSISATQNLPLVYTLDPSTSTMTVTLNGIEVSRTPMILFNDETEPFTKKQFEEACQGIVNLLEGKPSVAVRESSVSAFGGEGSSSALGRSCSSSAYGLERPTPVVQDTTARSETAHIPYIEVLSDDEIPYREIAPPRSAQEDNERPGPSNIGGIGPDRQRGFKIKNLRENPYKKRQSK